MRLPPTRRALFRAKVDRHRQVQVANCYAVLVVVQPQSAGDPSDERVVERSARGGAPLPAVVASAPRVPRAGGPTSLSFINGDPVRLTGRTVRYTEAANSVADRTVCYRLHNAVEDESRAILQRTDQCAADEAGVVARGVAPRAQPTLPRGRWWRMGSPRRTLPRRFGRVEERHRDLYTADAIGERVVELADHCRPAVVETVDEGRVPERPSAVEAFHRREPDHPPGLWPTVPGRGAVTRRMW